LNNREGGHKRVSKESSTKKLAYSNADFGLRSAKIGIENDELIDRERGRFYVQPVKLSVKQVKVLSEQFPFWLCSDIRH
jgi:hypothetical protein